MANNNLFGGYSVNVNGPAGSVVKGVKRRAMFYLGTRFRSSLYIE